MSFKWYQICSSIPACLWSVSDLDHSIPDVICLSLCIVKHIISNHFPGDFYISSKPKILLRIFIDRLLNVSYDASRRKLL